MKTINGIEVGRGLAALLVAVYHISQQFQNNFGDYPFTKVTQIGHSGVDFFFVLSGFIIYFIHYKDIGQVEVLRPYLIKRIVRVFPLYWLMLAATFALIPFVASADFPELHSAIQQIFLLPIGGDNLILGVSWTLQFEMVFYAVFALLIVNKLLGLAVISLWLTSVILQQFVATSGPMMPVIFSAFTLQFFMGCIAAHIILKTQARFGLTPLIFGACYLIGIWIVELAGYLDGYGKYARLHYGAAFMLMVIGIVGVEQKYSVKMPSMLMTLGQASYSIYLSHLFFSGIYFKLFEVFGVFEYLNISLAALIIIVLTSYSSILLSKWIEIPYTKKLRDLLLTPSSAPSMMTKVDPA